MIPGFMWNRGVATSSASRRLARTSSRRKYTGQAEDAVHPPDVGRGREDPAADQHEQNQIAEEVPGQQRRERELALERGPGQRKQYVTEQHVHSLPEDGAHVTVDVQQLLRSARGHANTGSAAKVMPSVSVTRNATGASIAAPRRG